MTKNFFISKIFLLLFISIFSKSNSQEYKESVGLVASFASGIFVPFLAKDIEKSIASYIWPYIEKFFGSSSEYIVTKPDELGINRFLEKQFILKVLLMVTLNQISKNLCSNKKSMLIKTSILGCLFGYVLRNCYLKYNQR